MLECLLQEEGSSTNSNYRGSVDDSDGRLTRAAWMCLFRMERVIGLGTTRRLATAILRLRSRTRAGYVRSTHRLVEREDIAPGILRLPVHWWRTSQAVSVKRLGLRLVLDLRDNLQRVLYFTGTYEPDVLARIRSSLRKGHVFIDIGAHIGVHALPVAKIMGELGGGRIYAFEPNPHAADILRALAEANGLDIEVVPLALSDSQGELTLRSDDRYPEADLGVGSAFGSGEPLANVHSTRFDDWARSAGLDRLDVVKIDVEGGELAALRGMENTLRTLRPRLVVVESKESSLERVGVTANKIHAFLASHDYRHERTVPFSNDIFVVTNRRGR